LVGPQKREYKANKQLAALFALFQPSRSAEEIEHGRNASIASRIALKHEVMTRNDGFTGIQLRFTQLRTRCDD
jgi:hypothetical protein